MCVLSFSLFVFCLFGLVRNVFGGGGTFNLSISLSHALSFNVTYTSHFTFDFSIPAFASFFALRQSGDRGLVVCIEIQSILINFLISFQHELIENLIF